MELTATSITDKLFSVGSKLAPLAGVYQGFMTDPMATANGDFGQALQNMYHRIFIQENSLGRGHFGNPLITTTKALSMPNSFPIISGATMWIGGWIAEMIGRSVDAGSAGSMITKFGTIMRKYGSATTLSSLVAAWLYLTPYNPYGQSGTGASPTVAFSPQMSFNIGGPNAPHTTNANGYKSTLRFEKVVA